MENQERNNIINLVGELATSPIGHHFVVERRLKSRVSLVLWGLPKLAPREA